MAEAGVYCDTLLDTYTPFFLRSYQTIQNINISGSNLPICTGSSNSSLIRVPGHANIKSDELAKLAGPEHIVDLPKSIIRRIITTQRQDRFETDWNQ